MTEPRFVLGKRVRRATVSAMETLMRSTITRAVKGTKPFTNARNDALATVRWILATEDGRFVAVNDTAQAGLVRDHAKATIYDGRDNEELKAKFFAAVLGVPLTVVILD